MLYIPMQLSSHLEKTRKTSFDNKALQTNDGYLVHITVCTNLDIVFVLFDLSKF